MAQKKRLVWLVAFAFCALFAISSMPACAPDLSQGDGGLRFCNNSQECTSQLGSGFECRLHLCQRIGTCSGDGQECTVPNAKGICATGKTVCSNGELVCQPVQVAAPAEICGNNLDDDCDGTVDISSNCACKPGDSRKCYDGTKGCKLKDGSSTEWECDGVCSTGTQTCTSNQTWGACLGATKPGIEICNGQDDDCNEKTDETFSGQGEPCGVLNQKGPCATGETVCTNGKVACRQTRQPKDKEICNGVDDDCNGSIDDDPNCVCKKDDTQACYNGPEKTAGIGLCKKGTQVCNDKRQWGPCVNEVTPIAEICDGKDNNCDGNVDENFPNKNKPCKVPGAKGACANGNTACVGAKEVCSQTVQSSAEKCNGIDDDCDGQVDNAAGKADPLSRACYTGPPSTRNKGICKDGLQTCSSGNWGACQGDTKPKAETCSTPGLDEDCDGQINENPPCSCTAGQTQKCGSDKGECKQGTQTCNASGAFGACTGAIGPKQETCNNKDDNCNGTVDEGFGNKGGNCTVGLGECKRSGTFVCKSDGSGTECSATAGTPGPRELCNGKDDNCNGTVDEGFGNKGSACTVGLGECKRSGTFVCKSDGSNTECNVMPGVAGTETCDNKDNDCDGSVDEGVTQACYTGPASTRNRGACKDGVQTCSNGTFGGCSGEVVPRPEIPGNNIDDNCDGTVDEGSVACADGTEDQVFTAGRMVGCNCLSSPCNATAAKALCAAGWRVCKFSEWKSLRAGKNPDKARLISAKMTCTANDSCPCKDPNGMNCSGSIIDANDVCEQSCVVNGAAQFWLFYTMPPTSMLARDECFGKFNSWPPVSGTTIGRASTSISQAPTTRNACLSYTNSFRENLAGGVMCCK